MAFNPVFIGDVIREVVTSITTFDFDGMPDLYFMQGEATPVFSDIKENGLANINTFPLIYLKRDFKESLDGKAPNTSVPLNIFILTPTDKDYSTEQRIEISFRPTLMPIYAKFINALYVNRSILKENGLMFPPHEKTDHPFWGTESIKGNVPFDVIEIENLKLKFINSQC